MSRLVPRNQSGEQSQTAHQTGSREPVWEAVQTASQTGSQEPVWEAVWRLLPDTFPDCFPRAVWEGVWEAAPDSFPDCFPDTFPGGCLGSSPNRFPERFPGNLLQTCQTAPGRPKRLFLGIGWFGRVLGRGRVSGRVIPYSIYISQFQTGTPKPRYIGFRAGGRENGTQNGQFRPVFGHILWPLSRPSLFSVFVL